MRYFLLSWICFLQLNLQGQEFVGWKYSKRISFNTSPSGADIRGDVHDFPLAIRLNKNNFNFKEANRDGSDIRFSSEEMKTPIPYQIEYWNSIDHQALIWVKVKSIKANSTSQGVYILWGNDKAKDASNASTVFATHDGFIGVWHLNEAGDTMAGTYKDATSNKAHATGVRMQSGSSVNTHLGKGQQFNYNSNQWIRVDGENRKLFDVINNVTFSIWAYAKSYSNKGNESTRALPGYETMFAKGDNSWRIQKFGIRKWHKPEAELIEMCVEKPPPNGDLCVVGKVDMETGKWFHIVGVHDHPYAKLYVNGVLNAIDTFKMEWRSGDHPVGIGNQSQFPDKGRQWDGMLDEARIMNVSKDDHWIKLEYESQREGQRFVTFGRTKKR